MGASHSRGRGQDYQKTWDTRLVQKESLIVVKTLQLMLTVLRRATNRRFWLLVTGAGAIFGVIVAAMVVWVQSIETTTGKESFPVDFTTGLLVSISGAFGFLLASTGVRIMTHRLKYIYREKLGLKRPEAAIEEKVQNVQVSMKRTIERATAQLDDVSRLLTDQQQMIREVVRELEVEFAVRISTLNELAERAEHAERRADEARAAAEISESSRVAVDSMIDRRLAEHLQNERRGSVAWGIVFTIAGALLGIPVTLLIANWPF